MPDDIYDYQGWSEWVEDDYIAPWLARDFIEAGMLDHLDMAEHEFAIVCRDDSWWVEMDGERITEPVQGIDNGDLWDFYDWYEAIYDEPPEKDIDYAPEGK